MSERPAWREHVEHATAAREAGDRETALRCFREALALRPDDPPLTVEVSAELRALGRFDEAEILLTALVERRPDSPRAWIGLGHIARVRDDHHQALTRFRQALALLPDHPPLLIEVATELREVGRLDEAAALLESRLASHPNPARLWLQLGLLAQCRDDSDAALRCFEEGIRAQPSLPECYVALTAECQRRGMFERAQSALASGLASGAPARRLGLAQVRLLRALGRLDDAIAQALWHWRQDRGDFECGSLLAELWMQVTAFEQAAGIIMELRAPSEPQRRAITRLRARLALARYDLDEAEQHLNGILASTQQDAEAHRLLARIHLMRGDTASAGARLETNQALLSAQPSQRQRAAAGGGLLHQLWREFRTNPFAERALGAALALPVARQAAAIAQVHAQESGHAGTAIAWLVALRRLGALDAFHPASGQNRAIPRRIVQFWDTQDIPDDILATMQSWPGACAGFEHRVFDDAGAEAFIERECAPEVLRAFRMAGHPAMRSDLFRLAFLSVRGGIYADADDLCRESLEDWLPLGCDLLLLQEDLGSIGNNFIAAAPRHPFIEAALGAVVGNVLERQGDSIWFISGPGALTLVFCDSYRHSLKQPTLPPGIRLRDAHRMHAKVSMHLPRAYKQDARHWTSPKAVQSPLFRPIQNAS